MRLRDDEMFDLFVTAIEGGSNYWYLLNMADLKGMGAKYRNEGDALVDWLWRAIENGEEIPVRDIENPEDVLGVITKESLLNADKLMQENNEDDYRLVISECWDANTADIFFQYAVMGEITFDNFKPAAPIKHHYFLFGKTVTGIYEDEGIDALINYIEDDGYDLGYCCKYPEGTDVVEILNDYDGWDGFSVITEEDYNRICDAQDKSKHKSIN